MTTATPATPAPETATIHEEPQAPDPTKDIDAKTTVLVLIASTIFVFGTVWILYYVFGWISFQNRVERVERAPTTQRDELREFEARMLQAGDEPRRKSIEDSMAELAK